MRKFYILIALLQSSVFLNGQSNPSNVINSGGTDRKSPALSLTDNVGEPFITTVKSNGNTITQGYLQPTVSSNYGFRLNSTYQGPLCIDKEEDAFISLNLTPALPSQTVTYLWTPPAVCPANNCAKIENLHPGVYSVTVAIAYKGSGSTIMYDTLVSPPFIISNATAPCLIKVYKGITPNGDGKNDVMHIDNIREFPGNQVSVYNRWGQKLFDVSGYDERDPSRSWPTGDDISKLLSSTYFYVIELGDGQKPIKGWVELLKD